MGRVSDRDLPLDVPGLPAIAGASVGPLGAQRAALVLEREPRAISAVLHILLRVISLDDAGPSEDMVAVGDILHAKPNQVASAQLTVDSQVEKGKVT